MTAPLSNQSTARKGFRFCSLFRRRTANRPAVAPSPAVAPPPSNGKLLVVDDDPVVRKAFQMRLNAEGYQVIMAADGPSAIQAARTEKPDVVLLDVNFPPDVSGSWDGFGILTWLRRLEGSHPTPVILISGNPGPEVWKRTKEAGMTAFLPKPVDLTALRGLLQYQIRRSRAHTAHGSAN